MAYTQSQLDALEAAIAEGSLVVQYDTKKVQYRTLDEMLRIAAIIRDALGLNTGVAGQSIVYPTFSKGLDC